MFIKANGKLGFNTANPDDVDLRNKWRTAIREGQSEDVKSLMEKEGIKAIFPTHENGETGLFTLLLADTKPEKFKEQTSIAKTLIAMEAHLTEPNRHGMIAADVAMMSRNTEAAKEIVIATSIHMQKNGQTSWKPDPQNFFVIATEETKRRIRFNAWKSNHEKIGTHILNEITANSEGDLAKHISAEQIAYWKSPFTLQYKDMPKPTAMFLRGLELARSLPPNDACIEERRDIINTAIFEVQYDAIHAHRYPKDRNKLPTIL